MNLVHRDPHQGGKILVPLRAPLRKQTEDGFLVVAERHRPEAY